MAAGQLNAEADIQPSALSLWRSKDFRISADGIKDLLVEVGARVSGGELPSYAQRAVGEGQFGWTVDASSGP